MTAPSPPPTPTRLPTTAPIAAPQAIRSRAPVRFAQWVVPPLLLHSRVPFICCVPGPAAAPLAVPPRAGAAAVALSRIIWPTWPTVYGVSSQLFTPADLATALRATLSEAPVRAITN
jgi:hypothetical protein